MAVMAIALIVVSLIRRKQMFDIESVLKEAGLTKDRYEQLLEDVSNKTYIVPKNVK